MVRVAGLPTPPTEILGAVLTLNGRINSVFPDMQFTMEQEENNQLAFLDVRVCRKDCGGLKSKLFQKVTGTIQVLNFNGNHPISHERSCVETHCSEVKNSRRGEIVDPQAMNKYHHLPNPYSVPRLNLAEASGHLGNTQATVSSYPDIGRPDGRAIIQAQSSSAGHGLHAGQQAINAQEAIVVNCHKCTVITASYKYCNFLCMYHSLTRSYHAGEHITSIDGSVACTLPSGAKTFPSNFIALDAVWEMSSLLRELVVPQQM
ncbi:unnamed protein product [Dibothriocephalus latus]|uniref:Uncharacterized protein n=1 Tax=Dibothriocephalus latus TaxID=60516 RepID=A0A3P7M973_DIBLA|nr:unnamed protein product [Dibothriocephalus latus]